MQLNKLKEAHKTQDIAAIDTASAELNQAWTAASEEIYKATQQAGANGGDGQQQQQQQESSHANAGGAENVTDAEFEEVK